MIIYRSTALCLFVLLFASAHGQKSPKLYMAHFSREDRLTINKNRDTSISWVRALDNLVGFPISVNKLYVNKFILVLLRNDRKAVCIDILKKKAGLDIRRREFLMDKGYLGVMVVSDTTFYKETEDWQSIKDGSVKLLNEDLQNHRSIIENWSEGSIWDLEIVGGKEKCFMVLRFEGDQTEEFEAFCQYIFKLAHFEGFKE